MFSHVASFLPSDCLCAALGCQSRYHRTCICRSNPRLRICSSTSASSDFRLLPKIINWHANVSAVRTYAVIFLTDLFFRKRAKIKVVWRARDTQFIVVRSLFVGVVLTALQDHPALQRSILVRILNIPCVTSRVSLD